MPLLLLVWFGMLRRPQPPPVQPGRSVCVEAVDISAQEPLLWKADLQVAELASEQFGKEKLFPLAFSPDRADFVFLILYDIHSNDHAEAGLLLRPDDFAKGAQGLPDLRREALWFGMERGHPGFKYRRSYSAARNLVHDFCTWAAPRHKH